MGIKVSVSTNITYLSYYGRCVLSHRLRHQVLGPFQQERVGEAKNNLMITVGVLIRRLGRGQCKRKVGRHQPFAVCR